jgi:hypothetical protein
VTRGREKGEPAHPRNSTGSGGNDISAHLCVWAAAAGFPPFQKNVTNREERKTSMPENIDPDAGLRAAGEQTGCRKQTRKGHHMRQRHQRGEQVSRREDENGAQS